MFPVCHGAVTKNGSVLIDRKAEHRFIQFISVRGYGLFKVVFSRLRNLKIYLPVFITGSGKDLVSILICDFNPGSRKFLGCGNILFGNDNCFFLIVEYGVIPFNGSLRIYRKPEHGSV